MNEQKNIHIINMNNKLLKTKKHIHLYNNKFINKDEYVFLINSNILNLFIDDISKFNYINLQLLYHNNIIQFHFDQKLFDMNFEIIN